MGAVPPLAVFFLLRVLLTLYRYYTYCTEHLRYTLEQVLQHTFTYGVADIFLIYFFPLGTNLDGKRLPDGRTKVVLAFAGPLENATVADKLVSWPALLNAFLSIVENLVGWAIILAYNAEANVDAWYAGVWCGLPTLLCVVSFVIMRCLTAATRNTTSA